MILFAVYDPVKTNSTNLKKWVEYLVPNKNYVFVNISHNKQVNITQLDQYAHHPMVTKVVALGKTASDMLEFLDLDYFKLPHPSQENEFLKNSVQVEAVLEECKRWISNCNPQQ